MVNLDLKAELIRRFGTQVEAASQLGIREAKLSYIIRGHVKPNEVEREALERGLGCSFVKKTLRDGVHNGRG